MLLVLSTLFGAYGGIPAFNRLLVQVASDHCQRQKQPLIVLALTDPALQGASAQPAGPPQADPLPDLDPGSAPGHVWWPAAPSAAVPLELRPSLAANVCYRPCAGDRRALLSAYLREVGRPMPLILGHVNLAPLGLVWPRPYGVIAHGSEVYGRLPWLRRIGLAQAHRIACVSDHTLACVHVRQGAAVERCVRVVNALPLLPACRPTGSHTAPLQLLCISRLHPAEPKGVDALLRAVAMLPADQVKLTVIGEGEARPALQALALSLGLHADRVRFLGAVSDEVRDAELDTCDVFVLPSESEGFGIVYLEALARGKPCIAARAGGAPEIIRDGETGFLVSVPVAAHVPELAAAILGLSNPLLRHNLGQTGRRSVEEMHTLAAFRQRADAFFAALLPDATRASASR